MSEINYREQWAEGEIEAGTLLDTIDALAQRCRELETESANLQTRLTGMTLDRNVRKEERDELRADVADLKARLLDAERGAEELVRLRADTRVLRIALDRIAERADAFVSDNACMHQDSAAGIAMIARNARETTVDAKELSQ